MEEKPGGRRQRYPSATAGCVHHSFLWEEPKRADRKSKEGTLGVSCCSSRYRKDELVTAPGATVG